MIKLNSLLNCYWMWFTGILSIITFTATFFLMVTNDSQHNSYDAKIEKQQHLIETQQLEISRLQDKINQ